MNFIREPQRFYLNDSEGKLAAEVLFPAIDDGQTWVIEHTFVRNDFRHQGLAGKLVNAVITAAKDENKQIQPLCNYAKAYFLKHPEQQAILKTPIQ